MSLSVEAKNFLLILSYLKEIMGTEGVGLQIMKGNVVLEQERKTQQYSRICLEHAFISLPHLRKAFLTASDHTERVVCSRVI